MKKKYVLFIILILILLFSCSNNLGKYFYSNLNKADSVKIIFYKDNKSLFNDTIIKYDFKNFKFKSQEKIFKKFISNENRPFFKCGYTGKIIYYRNNSILLEAEFNIFDECSHIVFEYKNKIYSKKISNNSLQFLKNLRNSL